MSDYQTVERPSKKKITGAIAALLNTLDTGRAIVWDKAPSNVYTYAKRHGVKGRIARLDDGRYAAWFEREDEVSS